MNRKLIVIDAKGHLLGRMCSYVAKQLELGQKICIVRCESVLIGGKHYRNKLNFMDFLHKRTNTNPSHGPNHHVAPSAIVHRTIRGMLPHKTPKGQAALGRLKCFDGCPVSMNAKKKMYIPDALKAFKLAPRAKYSVLGNIAKECGWTKSQLINEVETKRITRNHAWYLKKVQNIKSRRAAIQKNAEVKNDWYVIDAAGKTLGRVAAVAASVLRGKNKPSYTPNSICGDFVVIINADKVLVTGNKESDKMYYHHTGFVGGLKAHSFEKLIEKHPEDPLKFAIKGMLPNGILGRKLLKNVKIVAGSENPHAAQNAQPLEV